MSEKKFRLAADTGGTFTDLVVDEEGSAPRFYKRSTTPSEPVVGVFDTLQAAAEDLGLSINDLLQKSGLFIFGTTRATNAIVTGTTAKTALLVTEGHPDILQLREGGGRKSLFDYTQQYPEPYIPPDLTFEVKERIGANGEILIPLDENLLLKTFEKISGQNIEAIAVSLLWSPINALHETRVGELISQHLPAIPFTLSSRLNPSIREYRRMSSVAIDASLKPLMSRFFRELEEKLHQGGFDGRLLIMTSAGGVLDAIAVAETPIHSIGSGPAGAPIAGSHFMSIDSDVDTAIVTDAGGTTFDVSLLRNGIIPTTRETIVGDTVAGYITGFPSVDVKSVGAGGGSIAWVDEGGLLHVGPMSAGADPGPACYGRGGIRPTVTDACLVLGYIDPEYFLGGTMVVDLGLARKAIQTNVAKPLKLDLYESAAAILALAAERMVTAIEDITLIQGIDPENSVLIGGGGGAGLYCMGIAKRLNCWPILIPEAAAALSATGAILSDLKTTFMETYLLSTSMFDSGRANEIIQDLIAKCNAFIEGSGEGCVNSEIKLFVEGRYPHQVWEIEFPLRGTEFSRNEDIRILENDFHDQHDKLFAIRDEKSHIEVLTWGARVSCSLTNQASMHSPSAPGKTGLHKQRKAYFPEEGLINTNVMQVQEMVFNETYMGPLFVESPVTTLVIEKGYKAERTINGSILINPNYEPGHIV